MLNWQTVSSPPVAMAGLTDTAESAAAFSGTVASYVVVEVK